MQLGSRLFFLAPLLRFSVCSLRDDSSARLRNWEFLEFLLWIMLSAHLTRLTDWILTEILDFGTQEAAAIASTSQR